MIVPLRVGELKSVLNTFNDESVVLFEIRYNNEPADISFSIDQVDERDNAFCVLISND